MKTFMLAVSLTLMSVCLIFGQGQQSATKPLGKSEVLSLLSGGVAIHRVVALVKEHGIDFVADESYLSEVRKSGGDDELVALLQNATKVETVDCTQYEQDEREACSNFNELVRARDKNLLTYLQAEETYAIFDRDGLFDTLSYTRNRDVLLIIRVGYLNGQAIGGAPSLLTVKCSSDCGPSDHVYYEDKAAEGFRYIDITDSTVAITVGFSKPDVLYGIRITRSSGRYSKTDVLPEMKPTVFGKAAVYHRLELQP
jgi:hypothetical protein